MKPKFAALITVLLLTASGCSGGSSSGGGNPNPSQAAPPAPPPPPPVVNVTVSISVDDAFGAAVPNAEVKLLIPSGTGFLAIGNRTDANGQLVVVGNYSTMYGVSVETTDQFGVSHELDRSGVNQIAVAVTLHPTSNGTPGLGRLSVTDSSADGRQLEFSARLYLVEGNASSYLEEWNFGGVGVQACEPDAGNDGVQFTADCVAGPAGFDASYTGSTLAWSWVDPIRPSDSLAIALLLDQGASLAVTDPADQRLLGARYFQTRLDTDDQVVLAAFAADGVGAAGVAMLPNRPVTIFPVDNPAFTTDGRTYFQTIESLATLEGGASPLHAAIGAMIDFTESAAPADSQRAVVVLASDGANDCNTPADCRVAQAPLLEQSAAADVAVVAVGLSGPSGQIDRMRLGPLAQAEQGAVFWAQDPRQIPTVLGNLPRILGGEHGAVDVTVQLASPLAGTFASGRTVAGTLRLVICPWDCDAWFDVPFALRVP